MRQNINVNALLSVKIKALSYIGQFRGTPLKSQTSTSCYHGNVTSYFSSLYDRPGECIPEQDC